MILDLIQSKANFNKERFSIALILTMHIFGAVVIGGNLIENFILLTPFNLLMSLGILLWNEENRDRNLVIISVLCFSVGLIAEIIGTNTGLVFGEYSYGRTLGFQVGHVPLIIGVNWLMLVYASAAVVNYFGENLHFAIKAVLSAALMVCLDFFIEPVAMRYDFWSWAGDIIPVQNYIAWFVIAFGLLLVTHRLMVIKSKTAIGLFIAQLIFFVVLNFSN
ncbi:MAG: carotenoid biosynthesis protein [Saprospiraceae bacterium]